MSHPCLPPSHPLGSKKGHSCCKHPPSCRTPLLSTIGSCDQGTGRSSQQEKLACREQEQAVAALSLMPS